MSRNRYLPNRSVLGSMLEAAGVARKAKPSPDSHQHAGTPDLSVFSPPVEVESPVQSLQNSKINQKTVSKDVGKPEINPAQVTPEPMAKAPLPKAKPVKGKQASVDRKQDDPRNISFRFNPKLPMEENLKSFLMWLMNKINAEGGFLTDSHGLALVACNVSMDFIESTGALSQGLNQMSEFGPNTDMGSCLFNLGPKRHLLITWAETGEGRLFFGLVTAKILNPKRVRFIRMALKKIVG